MASVMGAVSFSHAGVCGKRIAASGLRMLHSNEQVPLSGNLGWEIPFIGSRMRYAVATQLCFLMLFGLRIIRKC
jgi:hypothetical protein